MIAFFAVLSSAYGLAPEMPTRDLLYGAALTGITAFLGALGVKEVALVAQELASKKRGS